MKADAFFLDGLLIKNRFFMGSSGFQSPDQIYRSVALAKPSVMTLSLKKEQGVGLGFRRLLDQLKNEVLLLPNTAGCFSAREAVRTACIAREMLGTHWIKLEVTGDPVSLFPDPLELLIASKELIAQGFFVLPYTNDDPVIGEKLLEAGCQVLMPLAAPIGSGLGPVNLSRLKYFRKKFPKTPLIIDAGIGRPSHACLLMEEGFDGILANTAIAGSGDPVHMAEAFSLAVSSGRQARLSQIRPALDSDDLFGFEGDL